MNFSFVMVGELSQLEITVPLINLPTALGSQFRSLYRSGTMADCGRKMDEFKFCLSLKSASPEDRRSEWIRRRAEWWARRRLGKSSEDVWEARR
jgi:hypothetical protein